MLQNADRGEALRSLEEVGVQAACVVSIDGRFILTKPQGVPLGQVKASGIYLTTDAEVRGLKKLNEIRKRQQELLLWNCDAAG